MKNLKVLLGAGAACAACCALPVGALAAALAGVSGAWAWLADSPLPALGIGAAALLGAGLWWRRRQAAEGPACAVDAKACACGSGSRCG